MSPELKREYLKAVDWRYSHAKKKEKGKILDEFCRVCGLSRKWASRVLRRGHYAKKKSPGPRKQYVEIQEVMKALWLLMEQMCSKRLKAALPLWLPFYERTTPLSSSIREKLLRISASSMDRYLKPFRGKHKRLCGTRPGTWLKNRIPIRTDNDDVDRPGFLEADTVAHCGESMAGHFVWSLTLTDIHSQWTENRALWNKEAPDVIEQVRDAENKLPFPILAFDVDNGSEFLNRHLWLYFSHRKRPVSLYRSRPYKKNNQAHVEQKNWTHVRQLWAYHRIEQRDLIPSMNDLYFDWGLLHNFFCPTQKLKSKIREGSRYHKQYEAPETPYRRLLSSPHIPEDKKQKLKSSFEKLNPLELKSNIEAKLKSLFCQIIPKKLL